MKRSKFSLSHYKLLSGNMGPLYPIGLMEVLPGDTIQQATSLLLRCSPLVAPVMHPVHVRVHHWFVPHRIVWDDWEDFITGGPDGMDDSTFPTITLPAVTGAAVGSLADYLGVPTGVASLEVSALPFRGYQLIFNEYYRDQDLTTPANISTASGADAVTSTALQWIQWEKDYFTSARPWEQKGPSITIPLGTSAPVVPHASQAPTFRGQTSGQVKFMGWQTGNSAYLRQDLTNATNTEAVFFGTQTGLETDLTGASAITVTALREALALQRFEEARARYGSRYVEYLRYLGIRSSDARLQRPEYLGGGKQSIQFSEVLATAETEDTPIGALKGHGIAALRSNRYRRFFEEHGYVYSFLSIRPRTMYVQGLPRTWNRRTKEEFFQRELQFIGQQEILNKELYAAHANPNDTFGWQDRYDDYRRIESTIAGEFRESQLDFWHMARIFGSAPALNNTFTQANPTDRIFAVPSEDTLYVMANHSVQARRLLAKKGTSFIY